MNGQREQGVVDKFLKGRPGALPALPVLVGCLLLIIWISFGVRALVIWAGEPDSQSGQFLQFIADPLAASLSSLLLTYLIKSHSTWGGKLLGLFAILIGLMFTAVLYNDTPSISPLLIFQILLTYLMGWFGGSVASGQFAARLKYRQGLAAPSQRVNKNSQLYRTLVRQVGGEWEIADRLIEAERKRHRNYSAEQLIEAALTKLSRDRK